MILDRNQRIADAVSAFPGYTTIKQRAAELGIPAGTLQRLATAGRIHSILIDDRLRIIPRDTKVPRPSAGRIIVDGRTLYRCSSCFAYKSSFEFYLVDRQKGDAGTCKVCKKQRSRWRNQCKANPHLLGPYANTVKRDQEILAIRVTGHPTPTEAMIQAHSERIEALGLAGDGEDWRQDDD